MILQKMMNLIILAKYVLLLYHTDGTKNGHLDNKILKKHVREILKKLKY